MGGLDSGFIAVGFDGTPESVAAVRWALGRAAGMQAAVKIVHCWPPARRGTRGSDAVRAVKDEVAAARMLVPQPPDIAMVFAAGPVESVLALHAQGAAMLVLGASAPDVLGDPARGPVAGPCLQRVGCPMVVVDRRGRVATARPRYPVLGLAG